MGKDLTGLKIRDSYKRLVQMDPNDTTTAITGDGNDISTFTTKNSIISGSLIVTGSSHAVSGSFGVEGPAYVRGTLIQVGSNADPDGILGFTKVDIDTTSGANTYSAVEFSPNGIIARDCNGSSRADVTPTAAQIVAAYPGCKVGNSFDVMLKNASDAAETITLSGGTGVTLQDVGTIPQNYTRIFRVYIANVTSGNEACHLYTVGYFTHA